MWNYWCGLAYVRMTAAVDVSHSNSCMPFLCGSAPRVSTAPCSASTTNNSKGRGVLTILQKYQSSTCSCQHTMDLPVGRSTTPINSNVLARFGRAVS